MPATAAMQTIPARILPTALRIPAPRIPARMQAMQTTAITKNRENEGKRVPWGPFSLSQINWSLRNRVRRQIKMYDAAAPKERYSRNF